MKIQTILHADKVQHLGMAEAGLREWAGGADTLVNGVRFHGADSLLLAALLSHPHYILRIFSAGDLNESVDGFAIERVGEDLWLEGLVLWVTPEKRRGDLVESYFRELPKLVRRSLLHGVRFDSTLTYWQHAAPRCGFSLVGSVQQQGGGASVLRWEQGV